MESPEHYLNSFVLGCRAATEKASSATAEDAAAAALAAHDALDHLALELASDLGENQDEPLLPKKTGDFKVDIKFMNILMIDK